MLNSILQWAGTTALITMYIVMSFFPNLYPVNIACGLVGGLLYLAWSIRVRNSAQVFVNLAGVLVCCAGLYKALG
jgi:hypothetical protein